MRAVWLVFLGEYLCGETCFALSLRFCTYLWTCFCFVDKCHCSCVCVDGAVVSVCK